MSMHHDPSSSLVREIHSSKSVHAQRMLFPALVLLLSTASAVAQTDPGIRGGIQNTAGYLQYRGIPIPHPAVISPHPITGATVNANELALFNEGLLRAGQLESTCD